MRKLVMVFLVMACILIGCSQGETKRDIYSESWNSEALVVKQINNNENEDDEIINEITDTAHVKKLIQKLKNAKWQDNVDVDIRPPDYLFTWNSFTHHVWIHPDSNRLELSIEGKSNFGVLSQRASETVFEILTSKE